MVGSFVVFLVLGVFCGYGIFLDFDVFGFWVWCFDVLVLFGLCVSGLYLVLVVGCIIAFWIR